MKINEFADKLKLPSINVGDEVRVGKFKNRKAEVTGFDKDEHNQPVLKTTKGDQKLFKPRISKLMNKDESINEGYKLQLERDADMMVLNITDTATGKRTEVRGKAGYETNGYDSSDRLHKLLDKIGKTANVSELINGEVVTINPNHPQGNTAKAATHTAFNESIEIEFICVNPNHCNATYQEDQNKLFHALKTVPGIIVYRQDFDEHNSMAAILKSDTDQNTVRQIEQLAKKYNVGIDLENEVSDRFIDEIYSGTADGLMDWYDSDHIKENINEAFDNPYPFKLTGPSESHDFVATAQTPNGLLRMEFKDDNYDEFSIDFAVDNRMGKTDAGDQFRVFATVVAIMKKWINTVGIEHVESFDFAADKVEHASDGRAKLYARFAKQLASQLGWRLTQNDTVAQGKVSYFTLTNPKPVPRDDEYWDALEENFTTNAATDKVYNESLDNPYPVRWSIKKDTEWYGHAKEDDFYNQMGIEIKSSAEGRWNIRFKVGEKMDKTGEGDQFKIFATVKAAIQEWWTWASKNTEVNQISFSSEKIVDSSRSKLYNRFAQQFARAIGYELEVKSGRNADIFYIKKPGLEENFADGKVKGKSRPGRVKRSGASCNGSVTELRKRAKNSSGEKAKMLHWCGNMKAGRQKKKGK